MSITTRLGRIQYVTDPTSGRRFPIPAGGAGEGEGAEEGSGEGEGEGEGQGEGAGEGEGSPLEQQALDAIEQLKSAGAEIPDALNAVVKEFRDARKEAGNHRTAKTAEQKRADDAETKLGQVLKALGVGEGEEPDPDALKQAVEAKDGELRTRTVELAAYKAASKNGANADALLDSASFLKQAAELDPAADTFSADLESAIKTAVENNPLLAASPGGGQGPAQGPRNSPNQRPKSLQDAVASRYSQ